MSCRLRIQFSNTNLIYIYYIILYYIILYYIILYYIILYYSILYFYKLGQASVLEFPQFLVISSIQNFYNNFLIFFLKYITTDKKKTLFDS